MKINNRHKLNLADIITLFRIVGTLTLIAIKPLSVSFLIVYTITGVTDILDGWIARKTHTQNERGAKLDSIADLLFYTVILLRVFPMLFNVLPNVIWYIVALIVIVRVLAYLVAAIKYHQFVALHTYLNKLTGLAVFLIPFALVTQYATSFCFVVSAVAALSSIEELTIHLCSKEYFPNTRSVLHKKNHNPD